MEKGECTNDKDNIVMDGQMLRLTIKKTVDELAHVDITCLYSLLSFYLFFLVELLCEYLRRS